MAKKLEISESISPAADIPHISKPAKEIALEKLQKFMQEESKLVRGIFQCFENPGATQKITYKKYPTPAEMRKRGGTGGVEPFSKSMTDGQEYEIPLYVARFLNGTDVTAGAVAEHGTGNKNIGTCAYSIHGFKYSGNNPPPCELGTGAGNEIGIPVPIVGVSKRVKRYGFQSLEFESGAA